MAAELPIRPIAHSALGLMGYWLRAHSGSRNNCSISFIFNWSWWKRFLSFCSRALLRLGGEAGKEGELRLWNLNICIEKVNAKCWLAEITLVYDVITLGACFHLFFYVCLYWRSFTFHADWPDWPDWRKSDSSVKGEPRGNWRRNSNSRDVVASSPSFSRPAARAPRRACW